jgi:predicted nicotinamide N-methyase
MDHLCPSDQARLRDILQYYDNYRRTHYDDNVGITVENRRREAEQAEIERHLARIREVQATELYQELSREKAGIRDQMDHYECLLWGAGAGEDEPPVDITILREIFDTLGKTLASLVTKQLELLEAAGVDVVFLDDKGVNIKAVL